MIGLLMAWAVVGTEGIPIPYSPRMDDGITVVFCAVSFCRPMSCHAAASSCCNW